MTGRLDAAPLLAICGHTCAELVLIYCDRLRQDVGANVAARESIDRIELIIGQHRHACIYTAMLAEVVIDERKSPA